MGEWSCCRVRSGVAGGLPDRFVGTIVSGDEGHCNGQAWGIKDALERSEVPTAKWRLDFLCGFPVMRDVLEMEGQLFSMHDAVMSRTRAQDDDDVDDCKNGLVVVTAGSDVVGPV